MSAGKGDKPRNCFSKQFKDNYDEIDWGYKSSIKKLIEKEKTIDQAIEDVTNILKELGE